MKIKKQNIVSLIILLLLQTFALIGAWNLKLGINRGFLVVVVSLLLSLITTIILFLLLSDLIPERYYRKSTKKELTEPERISREKSQVQREFADPKIVAEQIFKNVLLKRNISSFGDKFLQNLSDEFDGIQGVFYLFDDAENIFRPLSYYAMLYSKDVKSFAPGRALQDKQPWMRKLPFFQIFQPSTEAFIRASDTESLPLFILSLFIPIKTVLH